MSAIVSTLWQKGFLPMIVYYRCLIEGKGVTPSIAVEMKPEQLLAGKDPQMQRALDVVRAM
jgi:hypothetical protein